MQRSASLQLLQKDTSCLINHSSRVNVSTGIHSVSIRKAHFAFSSKTKVQSRVCKANYFCLFYTFLVKPKSQLPSGVDTDCLLAKN